jgi:RNA polymerase sigma-70 factor (ECF subfamily)
MNLSAGSHTSTTLLGRLRQAPTDQAAWRDFVARYGRHVYAWCRQWRLQEADAQDVTQIVLLKMSEKLAEFAYDPARSFRAWLKTVTLNAWRKLADAQRRAGQASGVADFENALAARDDLVARLEEEFDRELLEQASSRVRLRVEPHTWDAFRLMAFEGQSGAQVAERLQMKVATVFVAKSKVQKMLQEEIRKLEETG